MTGWAKDQGAEGSMLKFLGDPTSAFTKALGLVFDDPKAMEVLGYPRCKRFSMYIDDGKVVSLKVAEGDVPAEDTFVDKTLAAAAAASALKDVEGAKATALQYPAAAAAAQTSKTAASAFRTQPIGHSLTSIQRLPQAIRTYPTLPSQPLRAFKSFANSLPNGAMASQRFPGPRLYEESSIRSSFVILAAAMISIFVGSAVTFAVFMSRRSTSTMKERLLTA